MLCPYWREIRTERNARSSEDTRLWQEILGEQPDN